ncbi:MAG: TonB-dependent receptor [Bernardetiaceae bacterium]|nr:TonB-dependent receptor [Bernardetiaceae bacterium]
MSKNNLLSFLLVFFALIGAGEVFGQGVTTGNITGFVKGTDGETLPGATVIAVHTPTGTKYGSITNANGRYVITNVRVGGPYEIKVSYVGYAENTRNDLYVSLGSTTDANFDLREEGVELSEIVITSERNDLINSDRTGASTNLSNEQINELPTISRSINDFTRLTPQSNGTSFAGRDNRFNNYTVDGNIYNNNFGLGSGQFAGTNPISLDAIEEVQVNLAPFDVRQGGFTGANVNAITRSGTNKFDISVYSYFRNDQLIGDKVGEDRLNRNDSENTIMGFRVGGPIIKNKLFFFVNYEREQEAVPGFNKVAARDGLAPDGLTVSRVPASQLDFVREQMREIYGYETGPYEGYPFASEGERFNARLDYNINDKHKVSLRYNSYAAFRDAPTNGNSIRFINTRFRNTNRTGIEAMNFRNTNYTIDNNISSIVGELTSRFGDNISNQLNVGYTSITDPRRGIPGGQAFPFIEVLEPDQGGNLLYYFSLGNELFSVGNLLENDVLNITNNTSFFLGKHTVTAGVNFESMTFDNAFNPTFNGFYRFTSYDDFVAAVINRDPTVYPAAFANSFSFDGSTTPPTDQTRFGQLGLYIQDEFQVNERLKVTGGLRVDLPFYPIDLPRNENLDALERNFTDPRDGSTFQPDVSTFPRVRPLWSPRISANWDVLGNQTLQIRGGTGIFSGRIPFVWLSNQVNGSGVVRGGQGFEGQEVIDNGIIFDPDVNAYKPNPEDLEASLTNELNITDRNFKLPQVWRTNIAADYVLPGGIVATVEAIYSKDVSTPIAINPVLREPDGLLAGPDQRPYWEGGYSNDEQFRNVFQLTNAQRQGDYYAVTLQAQKRFDFGLNLMFAYTHSRARDYGLDGGSQAISLWSSIVSTDRNDPDISFTRFDIPNRVIGALSYNIGNTTTLSLFYEGASNGRFSYTYSGDFGDNALRLLYVPRNASELNFEEFTSGGRTVTVQEQQAAFDAYIDGDDYLSGIRGQVSERNGALLPWVNRFDFRLVQNIPLGKHKMLGADYQHKLQLTFDVFNIGNMFNSNWGVQAIPVQANLLNYRGRNANNEPVYRLNFVGGTSEFPTEFSDLSTRSIVNLSQTWRGQIGIRYIFN